MDLYIIELQHKVKVGRSTNTKKRLRGIYTGSGILDVEVINEFVFKNKGKFEGKIKQALKKHQVNGEWYYKKGAVINFLKKLYENKEINDDLIIEIQTEHKHSSKMDDALALFKKIREERKSIGFPKSPNINTIINSRKVVYKHFIYHISQDYSSFTRELKFDIYSSNSTQKIQCLRIIKNHQKSNSRKEKIQNYIDTIFNKTFLNESDIIKEIEEFFGQITVPNIDEKKSSNKKKDELIKHFTFDPLQVCYYSENKFKELNKVQVDIIKNTKNVRVENGSLIFNYHGRKCYVHFEQKQENIMSFIHNT